MAFSFLDKIINVSLVDNLSNDPKQDARLRVGEKGEYYLSFTKKVAFEDKILIHEAWHIFFDILSSFNEEPLPLSFLAKDIYAYSFESLVCLLKKELKSLC